MSSVVLRPTTRALFSLHRLLLSAPPFPAARRRLLLLPISHLRRPSPDRWASPARGRLGAVRAVQVNESGAIDSNMIESMEKKIKEQLSADKVTVQDAYGDGRHVSIDVISSAFEGQSAVNRQRMVYKAIWEELQTTVHAVDQMTTRTPAEAAGKQ